MLRLIFNPRFWGILCFVAALALAYRAGQKDVQDKFEAYRLQESQFAVKAEEAARAREAVLQTQNQKVTEQYENLKSATAISVGALDAERMRLESELTKRDASADTAAFVGPDASTEDRILVQCLSRYEAVAADAEYLSNQVTGLQAYIKTAVQP